MEERDCPEKTRSEKMGRCGGKAGDKKGRGESCCACRPRHLRRSAASPVAHLATTPGLSGSGQRVVRRELARPGLPTTPIHQQFHFISFTSAGWLPLRPVSLRPCLPLGESLWLVVSLSCPSELPACLPLSAILPKYCMDSSAFSVGLCFACVSIPTICSSPA